MKIDYNTKMNQNYQLLKRKNMRLKSLQEKEKQLRQENDNLQKVASSKEIEALSMSAELGDKEKEMQKNEKMQ